MKIFKGIDVFLQTGLILIVLSGLFINNEETISTPNYLVALGIVQTVSILIHLFIRVEWKKLSWRKVHHIGTLLVIVTLIIIFNLEKPANSNNQYYGLGAIVYTSVVALALVLFYFIISWIEWRRLKTAS
jgi:hypothetical protein